MAKRESIWKANDGTEHRSKQSAAVADAAEDIRTFVTHYHDMVEKADVAAADVHAVTAETIMGGAEKLRGYLDALLKARAALAKHEAKGEK